MYISPRKYTIIRRAMSKRLVEGGLARVAGQSCLAGPSVAPAAPKLRAPAVHRSMVGSHAWRVKLFYAVPRIFWRTTGRKLCGALSPTSLVPDETTPRIPVHRTGCLCASIASCRKLRQHMVQRQQPAKKEP